MVKQLIRVQQYINDLLCVGMPNVDSMRNLLDVMSPKDSLWPNMTDGGMRVSCVDIT